MTDDIDRAQDNALLENEAHVRAALKQAGKIPAGEPGECQWCGTHSQRLVKSACAPCREELNLP
ncbi:MAG: conjugal transfer protein TraR [Alphaproteobacteria bacterium]|nr:conjugal transfer protein TraR [Alphaproteobacteria bacterium]